MCGTDTCPDQIYPAQPPEYAPADRGHLSRGSIAGPVVRRGSSDCELLVHRASVGPGLCLSGRRGGICDLHSAGRRPDRPSAGGVGTRRELNIRGREDRSACCLLGGGGPGEFFFFVGLARARCFSPLTPPVFFSFFRAT